MLANREMAVAGAGAATARRAALRHALARVLAVLGLIECRRARAVGEREGWVGGET